MVVNLSSIFLPVLLGTVGIGTIIIGTYYALHRKRK